MDHVETNRLAWAFGISLALHLVVWGGWYSGHKLGWWENMTLPRWMQTANLIPKFLKRDKPAKPAPEQEPPLMFVNVSPAQSTAEAPKDAKFYSDKNSMAANPTADEDSNAPKIAGTQTQVPKTEDVPRKEFLPLQPSAPPKVKPAPEPQQEEKAMPQPPPGDIAFAKPENNPKPDTGDQPRNRPRTINEAMSRKMDSQIPGDKMLQQGGVRRRLELASLDAKATPFGAYDAAMVEAISQRWFSLLEQRSYASDSRGKVVLQFVLHPDGRVSEMNVADNSAGEVLGLICQKAVLDPAPFAPWPAEMRRLMGERRNIQFTFYYN